MTRGVAKSRTPCSALLASRTEQWGHPEKPPADEDPMLCPLGSRPLRPRLRIPLGERASLASRASLPIRGPGFAPTLPRCFQLRPNLRARVAKLLPTCQIPVAAALSCKARGLERPLRVRVDAKTSKRDSWKACSVQSSRTPFYPHAAPPSRLHTVYGRRPSCSPQSTLGTPPAAKPLPCRHLLGHVQ